MFCITAVINCENSDFYRDIYSDFIHDSAVWGVAAAKLQNFTIELELLMRENLISELRNFRTYLSARLAVCSQINLIDFPRLIAELIREWEPLNATTRLMINISESRSILRYFAKLFLNFHRTLTLLLRRCCQEDFHATLVGWRT